MDIITSGDVKSLAIFTTSITVSQAAAGTKLLRLKTLIGTETLSDMLILLISDVISFFNLPEGKNMNSDQVVFTAHSIIEEYPLFSLEDFALCFKRGKSSKYGKNYSAFDGQILMAWLRLYDLERDDCLSQEAQSATMKAPKEPILPGFVIGRLWEEIGKPIEDEKQAKEADYKKAKLEWFKQQQLKNKPNDSSTD